MSIGPIKTSENCFPIPEHLVTKILSYLSVQELSQVSQVCKIWYQRSQPGLIEGTFDLSNPRTIDSGPLHDSESWKSLIRNLLNQSNQEQLVKMKDILSSHRAFKSFSQMFWGSLHQFRDQEIKTTYNSLPEADRKAIVVQLAIRRGGNCSLDEVGSQVFNGKSLDRMNLKFAVNKHLESVLDKEKSALETLNKEIQKLNSENVS